jgi:hypothetical protein
VALSLDDFAPVHAGPPCSVAAVLEAFEPADRKVLVEAMANPTVQHSRVAAVLAQHGHRVNAGTIGRHRKGECRCGA